MTEPSTTPQYEEGCICFPPGEPPAFQWVAEVETAAAVRCPLHGMRFDAIDKPVVYQAKWLRPEDYATVDCSIAGEKREVVLIQHHLPNFVCG